MTDISPENVKRMLDGVTPGPWRTAPVDDCCVLDADGYEVADLCGDYNEPDLWPKMEANARFIAWAREAVPALSARLAEVETARDMMGELWAKEGVARQVAEGRAEAAEAENAKMREALVDMWAGWQYIRQVHGDLPGVGWDRCDEKARAALQGETK